MTVKLGLTDLANGQANYLNANVTFAQLNQLVQALVVDKDLDAPPGSPANEALYIVAASATGLWSGKSGQLAYWLTAKGEWTFVVPRKGMLVYLADEDSYYSYSGTGWSVFSSGGGGMTNPMTTSGDIIAGGASGAPERLAIGSALQVLRVNAAGTALEYADPTGGSSSVDIEDNGTPIASASTINFVGATVEDVGGGQVDITISGSGTYVGAPIRTITGTTGTITVADAGKKIECTNASPVTLTLDAEATAAWPLNTDIEIFQRNSGAVTVAGAGFTIKCHASDTLVLAGNGSAAQLSRFGSNDWNLVGRLVAA